MESITYFIELHRDQIAVRSGKIYKKFTILHNFMPIIIEFSAKKIVSYSKGQYTWRKHPRYPPAGTALTDKEIEELTCQILKSEIIK